jgi:hypothetical protein
MSNRHRRTLRATQIKLRATQINGCVQAWREHTIIRYVCGKRG